MAEFNPSRFKQWADKRRRSRSGSGSGSSDYLRRSLSDTPGPRKNTSAHRALSATLDDAPVQLVRSKEEATAKLLAHLYAETAPPSTPPDDVARALAELDGAWAIELAELVCVFAACGGALAARLPADKVARLTSGESAALVASMIKARTPLARACAAEGLELEPRAASAGSRLPTIVSGVDLSAYFSAAPTPAPAPAESSPALAELSLEEFILKVLSGSRLAVRRGFCEGEGIDSSDDDRSSWNPDECARAS